MPRAGAAKAKISVTVDADLVAQIDRGVRARRYLSRSAAIETALEGWARAERRRQRDAEIEEFYSGMTEEERAEDRQWTAAAEADLARIHDREEAPPATTRSAAKRRRVP